jgi:lysophospholipase L1-like esterase
MSVLLLGDSHLAHIRRDLVRVGPDVTNRAVGGSVAAQLQDQVAGIHLAAYDVVVVSVGTNDAAPWRDVTLPEFTSAIAEFLPLVRDNGMVFVRSPGVDEGVRGEALNRRMTEYADVAAALFTGAGGEVLDTPKVLAPLGRHAFIDDGLHLSQAGYDVLIPELARKCTSAPPTQTVDGALDDAGDR